MLCASWFKIRYARSAEAGTSRVTIGCAIWLSACIAVYAGVFWHMHRRLWRAIRNLDASLERLEATTAQVLARGWSL